MLFLNFWRWGWQQLSWPWPFRSANGSGFISIFIVSNNLACRVANYICLIFVEVVNNTSSLVLSLFSIGFGLCSISPVLSPILFCAWGLPWFTVQLITTCRQPGLSRGSVDKFGDIHSQQERHKFTELHIELFCNKQKIKNWL